MVDTESHQIEHHVMGWASFSTHECNRGYCREDPNPNSLYKLWPPTHLFHLQRHISNQKRCQRHESRQFQQKDQQRWWTHGQHSAPVRQLGGYDEPIA